ncbi:MAG: DUF1552 domain-containing protein [Myxococcales bacterium]|nr:DUF1552 domain-containing protein [Myxococcales bacterium]
MTEVKRQRDARRITRRHFLVGSAGFTLAIPLLPSLLSRAEAATSGTQKRLLVLSTTHGGIYPENILPADAPTMTRRTMHPASGDLPQHDVHYGDLVSTVQGSERVISNTLAAPATDLTPGLIAKLNFMTGFDIAYYLGHNRAATLGNYADNDQAKQLHGMPIATVDQVIAGSAGFYKTPPVKRSVHFGWSNPWETKNGICQKVPQALSPQVMWSELFDAQQLAPKNPDRPPVVDRVYEHYRRLTRGVFGDATRLSTLDKQRLEQHMQRLSELERQLSAQSSCGAVQKPPGEKETIEHLRQTVDLIVTAIICGATNVATLGVDGRYISQDVGWQSWHTQVAHNGCGNYDIHDPKLQAIAYRAQKRFFAEVFVYLVNKLDVLERGGATYLDNSLVYWSMECGQTTHSSTSMPVVTAGSAAGTFETGRYIDYRNRDNKNIADAGAPFCRPGVMLSRFHANVLQAFDVAPSEYRKELQRVQPSEFAAGSKYGGYGLKLHRGVEWGIDFNKAWVDHHFETADDKLPGWVKGA